MSAVCCTPAGQAQRCDKAESSPSLLPSTAGGAAHATRRRDRRGGGGVRADATTGSRSSTDGRRPTTSARTSVGVSLSAPAALGQRAACGTSQPTGCSRPVPGPQRGAAGRSCRGLPQPHAESPRVDRCGDGSAVGPIIVQATRRTPDWPRLLTVWAGPYDRRQVSSGALPFLPRTRRGQFAKGTAMTGNGPRPVWRRCTRPGGR